MNIYNSSSALKTTSVSTCRSSMLFSFISPLSDLFLAQVVSMLRDSKLKVFYSPPANDLRLNLDLEEERDRQEYQRPWPDLENLFGDDLEYQKYLTDIGSYMAMQLEQVKQFSHVSFPLMENVFLTYQRLKTYISQCNTDFM